MRLALGVVMALVACAQTPLPSPILGSGGGGGGPVPASSVTAGTFGAGAFTFPGSVTMQAHNAMGGQGVVNGTDIFGSSFYSPLWIRETVTGASVTQDFIAGESIYIDWIPPTPGGFIGNRAFGLSVEVQVPSTANNDFPYMAGITIIAEHDGGGTITGVGLASVLAQSYLGGAGHVPAIIGYYTDLENFGSGTADHMYHFWADVPINNGGGTVTTDVAFYASAQANADIPNSYSFWSDEQGVYRIKSDNTFDSVYQAIPALYNPQFTKYTPGAENYERIVEQWNGNVAEIGVEKGGTGTFRNLKLLGANYILPSLSTGAAGGKHTLCVDSVTKQLYESSTGTDCSN